MLIILISTDFDECGNNTDNCSALATCHNTVGSFNCSCNSGYIGNGYVCSGKKWERERERERRGKKRGNELKLISLFAFV